MSRAYYTLLPYSNKVTHVIHISTGSMSSKVLLEFLGCINICTRLVLYYPRLRLAQIKLSVTITYRLPSWKTAGQLFVLSAQKPLPRPQGLRFFFSASKDHSVNAHKTRKKIPEAKHKLTLHLPRSSATNGYTIHALTWKASSKIAMKTTECDGSLTVQFTQRRSQRV